MLFWQSDKLNVFSESRPGPKFASAAGTKALRLKNETVKYKRMDEFTVLALVIWHGVGVVFTNEISQTTWEIIGVFFVKDLAEHLVFNKHTLVDYESVESSYADRKAREPAREPANDDARDSDDEYWNQYGQSSSSDDEKRELEQKGSNDDEDDEDYWKRYGDQPQQIDDAAPDVRGFAVQAILDLAELYKDCGITDLDTFESDLKHIAFGDAPPETVVPTVPHRHAERTVRCIQEGEPAFKNEVLAALLKLKAASQLS